MADLNKAQSMSLKINQAACSPAHDHPNILTIYAAVDLTPPATTITPSEEQGHIKAQLIAVGKMRLTSPQGQQFYHECQAYDVAHSEDCARLDKVENYLANESFIEHFVEIVASADNVLFVEEVWLHRSLRGKGLSLVMVKELIKLLTLGFSEWSDSDNAWLLLSTPLSE
ncbi:hypothetical protein LTR27_007764 [Elasticomyces elasticus]|nr:hypothetical protein LTR27_007764 [Elasticomyces elasticus]